MPKEQKPRGREVVVSRETVPGTGGYVHVFRTEYDPNAEPIPSELEHLIRSAEVPEKVASLLASNVERIRSKAHNGKGR